MTIYSFNDPVDYLEAVYANLKQNNPNLSVRKWSEKMGLESQEIMFEILKRKKKIPLSLIPALNKFLELNSVEAKFFETLILLSRATSNNEIKLFSTLLAEQKASAGEGVAIVHDDNIFSHWIHMVILSMSKLSGFACTPETISEIVKEDVTLELVEEAVERLLRLGLIKYNAQGSLEKVYTHTTTQNDVSKQVVHNYYQQINELSRKAIPLPVEEREFQCFSMAIKSEEIPHFKEAIRQFRYKVSSMTAEGTGDQVYQFNIQFFPLTGKINNQNKTKNPSKDNQATI